MEAPQNDLDLKAPAGMYRIVECEGYPAGRWLVGDYRPAEALAKAKAHNDARNDVHDSFYDVYDHNGAFVSASQAA